jgi:hypothetical protein
LTISIGIKPNHYMSTITNNVKISLIIVIV